MADYEDEWIDEQKPSKGHKEVKAKNKMPAPVQITAEQLLREAKERELEVQPAPPEQKISSIDELKEYQLRKRKDFEDNIRKSRVNMKTWIRYAGFEEKQGELIRARSVFERALDVDPRNVGVWMRYAEMEMRAKQINHARNVWDRAVTILPRADQFWYRYAYMEELVGNVAGCRQVFERWMEWEPQEQAWHTYINFELRYKELDRSRVIFERFVIAHPEEKNWIKYAKFEERNGFIHSARQIFERADEYFETYKPQAKLLIEFARFEERQKEHERARVIYKYALDNLPKEECEEIYKAYTIHEKKFGDRIGIEDVILSKKKFQYEDQVTRDPTNYDAWFDYIRLMEPDEEEECKVDDVRELYERAIANVPPINEKRHWRRYIYLWINYALFEELIADDIDRCRQVYRLCLEELLPHKVFTFSKLWLMWAKFEIRQKDLPRARRILGSALGICPTTKLFREYIQLEMDLREFDRCRRIYDKFLEFAPENCVTWREYAEMENMLGETERARAIFDLAINQPVLDMPELLWKTYIDFERENDELNRARKLYRSLLERTNHVKVWVSLAHFELTCETVDDDDEEDENSEDGERSKHNNAERQEALLAAHAAGIIRAREIYKEANRRLRETDEKEHRVRLLENWRDFEAEFGDAESQGAVVIQMPERIKRRRRRQMENGEEAGEWEEYFDYVFPDVEGNQPNLRLLAMATKWKKRKVEETTDEVDPDNPDADTDIEDDDSDDDDDDEEDDDEENSD